MESFKPGDEYDLVDAFAKHLGLQKWFEWREDSTQAAPGKREGTTNPELLKEKYAVEVMYCLDALRRFDAMDPDQVMRVAAEIAVLGRGGLDYASPDQKYTLSCLPDERFSGLHLLCLMYAGFQRVDPSVDLQLDLGDAYSAALKLHQAGPAKQ